MGKINDFLINVSNLMETSDVLKGINFHNPFPICIKVYTCHSLGDRINYISERSCFVLEKNWRKYLSDFFSFIDIIEFLIFFLLIQIVFLILYLLLYCIHNCILHISIMNFRCRKFNCFCELLCEIYSFSSIIIIFQCFFPFFSIVREYCTWLHRHLYFFGINKINEEQSLYLTLASVDFVGRSTPNEVVFREKNWKWGLGFVETVADIKFHWISGSTNFCFIEVVHSLHSIF